MTPLTCETVDRLEARIAAEFGTEPHDPRKYLFDQITRIPEALVDVRLPLSRFLDRLEHIPRLFLFFDRHPNNAKLVARLLASLGLPRELGFEAGAADLRQFLSDDQCDMYVTTTDGQLLAVGCHEDDVVQGERVIWTVERADVVRRDKVRNE